MTHVFQVIAALMLTSSSSNSLSIFDKVGRDVTKEIVAIKTPIDETISYIGSTQCAHVKKIFGMEYDQVKGNSEPDLTQLTLNFISDAIRVTYNISEAAKLIPLSRGYEPKRKLVIFVHGFTDDPTKDSFKYINTAFLTQNECNILALDGSSLIRWFYLRATTCIRFMGEKLAETLHAMVKSGLDPSSIHLIGHSLGAHVSGFAGKKFTELSGSKVGRISALDPAGPCFSHVDPDLRLKASDADFVDVIHTDAGVYGLTEPVGHVDFYPNSGSQQPNCLFQTCSHSRAWVLYSESVTKPQAFPSVRCKDWDSFRIGECDKETIFMGYGCSSEARGVYFLMTGEDPPYGLGQDGVKYKNNEGIIRSIGAVGTSIIQPK